MTMRMRSLGSKGRRRTRLSFEALESRRLLAVLSGNGGEGGTTQSTPLSEGLNLVRFQWENFSIPDEFQILHKGVRIAGDVGLQSGGDTGSTVVVADGSSEELTVKVTAPLQGTAWNFTVEVVPFELNVTGLLGDVFKIDIVKELQAAGVSLDDADFTADGFALQSLTNNRGKVAEIDNYEDELKKGVFYFIPEVSGTILDYLEARSDDGLGESELTVTNNGHEFKIKLNISNGASISGDNAVTFGTKKLDIYRQQQRLSYLGFPGASGNALVIDGDDGTNTNWARKMFSVATNPNAIRPRVTNSGIQHFKSNINNANAPVWNRVDNIENVDIVSARDYGIHTTGEVFTDAAAEAGVDIISTGAALAQGTAPPSSSHDAGRGIDIDNIPSRYLFQTVGYTGVPGGYVRAPGPAGSIVVRSGATYEVGNVSNAVDRANGLRTTELAGSAAATLANELDDLDLLVYTQTEEDVRSLLEAFTGAGVISALYNDPRFLGETINGVEIRFFSGHFNHMHFNIPNPITTGPPSSLIAPLQAPASMAAPSALLLGLEALVGGAIDLGRPEDSISISGTLDATNTEQVYRFEIGDVVSDYPEREYFDTPRDLTATLGALTADADLQILEDLNENGVFDDDEVLYDSVLGGTSNETIDALQLPSGEYYVRVLGKGNVTDFDLELSLAPLPVPADNAGNTLAAAAELGVISGKVNASDFIGEVDSDDYYRLEIDAVSDVELSVTGLSIGDAALAIGRDGDEDGMLDAGEWLSLSDEEGDEPELVQLGFLPAGEYFVRVNRISGNSNYDLTVVSTASNVPGDPAGDDPTNAMDLGMLASAINVNGFVGDLDPVDVFKFSVASTVGFAAMLGTLGADADIELYKDLNGDKVLGADELLASSYNVGTLDETIVLSGLVAGEYYLVVQQYEGDATYELTLTPSDATGADLEVVQQVVSPTPNLGDQFSYTVSVTNNGPDTAASVMLVASIPAGLDFISASGQNGSVQFTGDEVVVSLSSLASGETEELTISGRSYLAGDLIGSAAVTSGTTDYNPSNDSIVQSIFISPIVSPDADLELSQSVSDTNPTVGDQISISLLLENRGPGTATVIRVGNSLPAGLSYVSSNATLGSYDPATGVWTVGNMPPNVQVRLDIITEVTQAATIINTAEVIAVDESDPDSTPNNGDPTEDDQASATIDVQGAGPAVTSFVLINALTDQPIRSIFDGDTIDLAELPTDELNIVAVSNPAMVGSVRFDYDGQTGLRVENFAAYALFGDHDGDFFAGELSPGDHTLTAVPFSESHARGDAGNPLTIEFTVIESPPEITGFVLYDADSDQPIKTLSDGATLDLDTLPTTNLTIIATADPLTVGSVQFDFDGVVGYRIENAKEYSLFGDLAGDFYGRTLAPGKHSVTATPFTESQARGVAGVPLSISFDVVAAPSEVIGFTLYDADNDEPIASISDGDTIDLDQLPTSRLNIRAEHSGKRVDSMRFGFDAEPFFQVENVAPYFLFGNRGNDVFPGSLSLGQHTLTATPYDEEGLRGQPGIPLTISFEVVGARNVVPPSPGFLDPRDTNRSGSVTPLDALLVINALGRTNSIETSTATASPSGLQLDTNRDGLISASDALHVINHLGRKSDVEDAAPLAEPRFWTSDHRSHQIAFDDQDDDEDLLLLLATDQATTLA